jgi:hypothetical protein
MDIGIAIMPSCKREARQRVNEPMGRAVELIVIMLLEQTPPLRRSRLFEITITVLAN